jgi:hypothetical protein
VERAPRSRWLLALGWPRRETGQVLTMGCDRAWDQTQLLNISPDARVWCWRGPNLRTRD